MKRSDFEMRLVFNVVFFKTWPRDESRIHKVKNIHICVYVFVYVTDVNF